MSSWDGYLPSEDTTGTARTPTAHKEALWGSIF